MSTPEGRVRDKSDRGCNVSSRLNFGIGATAVAVGIVIGYFVLNWLR
jgi:hypothetical protein